MYRKHIRQIMKISSYPWFKNPLKRFSEFLDKLDALPDFDEREEYYQASNTLPRKK